MSITIEADNVYLGKAKDQCEGCSCGQSDEEVLQDHFSNLAGLVDSDEELNVMNISKVNKDVIFQLSAMFELYEHKAGTKATYNFPEDSYVLVIPKDDCYN